MIKDILYTDKHMSRLNEEEKSRLAFLQGGKARESHRYIAYVLVDVQYI